MDPNVQHDVQQPYASNRVLAQIVNGLGQDQKQDELSLAIVTREHDQKQEGGEKEKTGSGSCNQKIKDVDPGPLFGPPGVADTDYTEFTKWEHIGTLGKGGFATVYHARSSDGREAAVKKIDLDYDCDDRQRRFERAMTEVTLGSRLSHPHIIKIYDVQWESRIKLAPEMMQDDYSCLSDIWSLGCVVIEMVSGKLPWYNINYPRQVLARLSLGESPAIPDNISSLGRSFLCRTLTRAEARPTATQLLLDPWVSGARTNPQEVNEEAELKQKEMEEEKQERKEEMEEEKKEQERKEENEEQGWKEMEEEKEEKVVKEKDKKEEREKGKGKEKEKEKKMKKKKKKKKEMGECLGRKTCTRRRKKKEIVKNGL